MRATPRAETRAPAVGTSGVLGTDEAMLLLPQQQAPAVEVAQHVPALLNQGPELAVGHSSMPAVSVVTTAKFTPPEVSAATAAGAPEPVGSGVLATLSVQALAVTRLVQV